MPARPNGKKPKAALRKRAPVKCDRPARRVEDIPEDTGRIGSDW